MRGTRTYCSSACLPLLCPSSPSSATYDHSHEDMGHHPRGSRTQQRTHMNITTQTLDIHALLLAEQSLGESVMAISPSTPQRLMLSENPRGPPSNGVCSGGLVKSRASSESRISPLTASAVTRATTSLHTSPPFIVVRLVRELMSVRVHAASFLSPARPIFAVFEED